MVILKNQNQKMIMKKKYCFCHFTSAGSDFLCATHIIPVKNEEGVVMMFILSFDYVLKEGSMDSLDRLNHTSPSKQEQSKIASFLVRYL